MVYYQLSLHKSVTLKSPVDTGSIIIFQSASLNTKPTTHGGFDNTYVNLLNKDGDVLLHISLRYSEKAIVFNSRKANGNWGKEERESLEGKFKTDTPSITVYEHPDRYQVFFDLETVKYYNKRMDGKTAAVGYDLGNPQNTSALSNPLGVNTFDSFAKFVGGR